MANHGDDAWGVFGTPRTILAPDGEWRIFEFRSPFYEPKRHVLVFHAVTNDSMFRVPEFPRDWQFLSDEELMALKERALPA